MVAIQLDQEREKRLSDLAASQGKLPAEIVRQIVEDYLDLQNLPASTDEDWAETSVALSAKVVDDEDWDEN